jgi:hypothetical protein
VQIEKESPYLLLSGLTSLIGEVLSPSLQVDGNLARLLASCLFDLVLDSPYTRFQLGNSLEFQLDQVQGLECIGGEEAVRKLLSCRS